VNTSPGWYPDPWSPSSLRWWDGSAWSYEARSSPARTRGNRHSVLLGSAVAWSVLLILLAIWRPVYTVNSNHAGPQPMHSLVRVFGYRVLLLAAIPFVISVVVALLLQLRVATQRRWPAVVASTLAWAMLVAAIVGSVTILIGIYVLPVGVLLSLATTNARGRRS
jgi:hypothetical protein